MADDDDARLFEGERIDQTVCVLRGNVGDARLNEFLRRGAEVVVVARAKVGKLIVDETRGAARRQQVLDVLEGFVVTDALDADDLIQKLRVDRENALSELLGPNLFDEGGDSDPE